MKGAEKLEQQEPPSFARAGVAGLGLIGGSLALALSRAGLPAAGFDTDADTVRAAQAAGIAAETSPDALFEADLVFVALFPDATVDFVTQNAHRFKKGALVVDCCGIKSRVVRALGPVAAAHGFRFIGGHPMAGKERGGFAHADAALFAGASFLLVPPEGAELERADVPDALCALLERLGFSRIVVTTAARHDRMIAFTSQLPHALAAAYVMSPCCPGHAGYSAGSYRDVSRVAHLNPQLWASLFLENQDAFVTEADGLLAHLRAIRDAVAADDRQTLERLLTQASKRKDDADANG